MKALYLFCFLLFLSPLYATNFGKAFHHMKRVASEVGDNFDSSALYQGRASRSSAMANVGGALSRFHEARSQVKASSYSLPYQALLLTYHAVTTFLYIAYALTYFAVDWLIIFPVHILSYIYLQVFLRFIISMIPGAIILADPVLFILDYPTRAALFIVFSAVAIEALGLVSNTEFYDSLHTKLTSDSYIPTKVLYIFGYSTFYFFHSCKTIYDFATHVTFAPVRAMQFIYSHLVDLYYSIPSFKDITLESIGNAISGACAAVYEFFTVTLPAEFEKIRSRIASVVGPISVPLLAFIFSHGSSTVPQ